MKKLFCKKCLLLFIAVLVYVITSPLSVTAKERKETVLVLPITAPTIKKELRSFLTDSLISQLIKSEKYEFISGKIVNDAMRAAFKKQAEEGKEFCDETACIREVAESFGTELVLSSRIIKDEKTFFINVQLKKGKVYKAEFEINLEADDYVKRKVTLERTKGKIKITSDPSGASIYIDGKEYEGT